MFAPSQIRRRWHRQRNRVGRSLYATPVQPKSRNRRILWYARTGQVEYSTLLIPAQELQTFANVWLNLSSQKPLHRRRISAISVAHDHEAWQDPEVNHYTRIVMIP